MNLQKLHGLGNDFLVLFTQDGTPSGDLAELARRVCERHRGVGADGLLVATPGTMPLQWTMTLFNADGSRAEMSGNGIRCFAHAVVRHAGLDLPVDLTVSTDGGERRVSVRANPSGEPDTVVATVAMGAPAPGPDLPSHRPGIRDIERLTTWDLGNPHVVLLVDDPTKVDLATEGPAWEDAFAAGINVHFIAATGEDQLTQVTWERGAGITQACGTGATAAALSAHEWGLVGDTVNVAMPGGAVDVRLGDTVTLTGPSAFIADVEVRA